MTLNNISEIRPHRVNAGGIFIALLKGALQPLSCVVTVPLTLLFPSLTTFFLYHVFSKQNDKILSFKKGLKLDFKAMLGTEILYLLGLTALFRYFCYKASEFIEVYKYKAVRNPTLQIATPEQLEYSHALTTLISTIAVTIIILQIIIMAYSFIKAYDVDRRVSTEHPLKIVFSTIFRNLPVYILFTVALIYVFAIIETYFAKYKLLHIEGYILGKDNFDPAITFMIIRIFVLHISIYALNLFTFCALNIREKLKFKN